MNMVKYIKIIWDDYLKKLIKSLSLSNAMTLPGRVRKLHSYSSTGTPSIIARISIISYLWFLSTYLINEILGPSINSLIFLSARTFGFTNVLLLLYESIAPSKLPAC